MAPFTGVLVDEPTYRFYRKQDLLAKRLDQEMKDMSWVSTPNDDIEIKILLFGSGILLGGIMTWALLPKK